MAFRDLAAKSKHYYQADTQEDAEKRRSDPKSRHQQHQSEHEIYCHQMGIHFAHGMNGPYTIRKSSYFYERMREFRGHTHQYWLVASLTTLFFLLQVVIGAIQTALGATHSPHILVTVFGAVATVIGGILAYLKSRGQPNRARQLRNSLRKVVEEIEYQEIQLRNPKISTTAQEAVDYINQLYEDARFQAETNYPDFWSTAGTKATRPGSGVNGPAMTANQSSVPNHSATGSSQRGSNQTTGIRPPSYHPASVPPMSTQDAPLAPSANTIATASYPIGPTPPNRVAHIPSEGGTSIQAPDPAGHIPSEGGKPLQAPHRAAHISTRGGRYMNEVV